MSLIETALLAIGVSTGTTALVIVALRAGGPIIGKIFGAVVKTRAELDADRDRIITNLREEIADYARRTEAAEDRANAAERISIDLRSEIRDLNHFIDTLLGRLGTTRQEVENGSPLLLRRPRKP